MRSLRFVPTLIALCAVLMSVETAAGQLQLTVRQDGTGDFTTIGAALGSVGFGGAIITITDNGTYTENILIGTPMTTVQAAQNRYPVLKPAITAVGSVHVDIPAPLEVNLIGLTLDGDGSLGDGIRWGPMALFSSLRRSTVKHYRGAGAHAVHVASGAAFLTIDQDTFVGNTRGLTVVQCDPVFLFNSLFYNTPEITPSIDWAVKGVDAPSWFSIVNCTVDTDETGPGVILDINNLFPVPGPPIPGLPLPCTEIGRVSLANSICANGTPTLTINSGPLCAIQSNCLDGDEPLMSMLPTNNLYGDPEFADRDNLDFGLQTFSPCRNSGADAYLLEVAIDIEGTCRPISTGVDRGAYEETGANCHLVHEWVDPNLLLFVDGPVALAGKDAFGAASFLGCPGIQVPTGRIPLVFDSLLTASRSPSNAFFFGGMDGVLDAMGDHTGSIFIPASVVPLITGISFNVAYAIFEPGGGLVFAGHSIATRVSF